MFKNRHTGMTMIELIIVIMTGRSIAKRGMLMPAPESDSLLPAY